MEKKNRAAKAINTALGLIVIAAVILASPLFGYARGFSTPEQRQAALPTPTSAWESAAVPSAAATPRPTAQPTPAPVSLPSAPPVPDPTPEPTPKPVKPVQQAAQQPVQQAQQNVQQVWQPEEAWDGEADWGEGYEETPEETVSYEGIGEQAENGVIATGSADIVINTDLGGNSENVGYTESSGYTESVGYPESGGYSESVDYGAQPAQDYSEGELIMIG